LLRTLSPRAQQLGEVARADHVVGIPDREKISRTRRGAWSPFREQLRQVAGADDSIRRADGRDIRGARAWLAEIQTHVIEVRLAGARMNELDRQRHPERWVTGGNVGGNG